MSGQPKSVAAGDRLADEFSPFSGPMSTDQTTVVDDVPQRPFALQALHEVKRRKIPWLWPGWVPANGVSLLPGDPKLAKSTLALDLAARLSRGEVGDPDRPPTSIVVSGEDSVAEVVEPRVAAAGGDLHQVHALDLTDPEAEFTLPDQIPDLEKVIAEIGAQLVIVDPLNRFLAESVDGHKDQSIRRAMGPLHQVAERQKCAILVVAHLNKAVGGNPLYRVGGSIGLTGAARSVMLFAKDPDDPDGERGPCRILAQVGSNYGQQQSARRYRIEPVLLPATGDVPEVETIRLVDEGEVEIEASDLLATPTGEDRTERDEAVEFLEVELADGPKPMRELLKGAPCGERTLRKAKTSRGVVAAKDGLNGPWKWSLPERCNTKAATGTPCSLAAFDEQARNGPSEGVFAPKAATPESVQPSGSSAHDQATLADAVLDPDRAAAIAASVGGEWITSAGVPS